MSARAKGRGTSAFASAGTSMVGGWTPISMSGSGLAKARDRVRGDMVGHG